MQEIRLVGNKNFELNFQNFLDFGENAFPPYLPVKGSGSWKIGGHNFCEISKFWCALLQNNASSNEILYIP